MNLLKMFSYYELIIELAKKEIRDKVHGNVLGALWLIFIPLVQMGLYVVFFSYILELKISDNGLGDYGLYILSGMIPWVSFVEVLNKSSVVIRANSSLVKQVIFPIEVLPLKGGLASLISQGIFHFILAIYLAYKGLLSSTYALIIPLYFLQIIFFSGVSFFISTLSVFLKDIREMVYVFSMVGIYILPIIFTMDTIPKWAISLIKYNPLSHMIFVHQDVCYFGNIAHPISWIIWGVFCPLFFIISAYFFESTKQYFGDYV